MKNFFKSGIVWIAFLFIFTTVYAQEREKRSTERLRWWEEARFGMFVHWGLSSLSGQEISWSRGGYGPEKYDSLALRFNPVHFDAEQWVATAKAAGMKYIVLTAKHHDGFCLWNTRSTEHNIMHTPFGRDVCKELAEAGHKAGIKVCWYFSLRDWKDKDCSRETNGLYVARLKQQLTELLGNYGEISLLWYDYDGWASPILPEEVNDLVFSLQPNIIVNNRSEVLTPDESHAYLGKYGDYATPEQFIGSYGEVPWETCANLSRSGQWAWRWNDKPVDLNMSVERIMRCAGGNGNLLLNVGPDSLGVIPVDFAGRLEELGNWLKEREVALYGTKGGPYKPGGHYSSTRKGNTFYLTAYQTDNGKITLPPLPAKVRSAVILGGETNGMEVAFRQSRNALEFELPTECLKKEAVVISVSTDRNLMSIPAIAPEKTKGSLAYNRKVTASSSINDIYMHNPEAIADDNPGTAWIVGRREDADPTPLFGTQFHFAMAKPEEVARIFNDRAWLEIDLGKKQPVSKFILQARRGPSNTYIEKIKIQYLKGKSWITLASRECKSPNEWNEAWTENFPEIKARKFRIEIEKGNGYFGISEFELFSSKTIAGRKIQ